MKVWNTVRHSKQYGVELKDLQVSWNTVMNRKNDIIDKIIKGKGPYLERMGVDLLMGEAQFISRNKVKVGGEIYSANRFLIGTGSEPILPKIEGIELAITSKELLYLEDVPKRIVIVGGGIIAMEFAHMLAAAGSEVILVHRGDTLLKNEDSDISEAIEKLSREQGIDVFLNSQLRDIKESYSSQQRIVTITSQETEKEFTVDAVLIAAGRQPAINGLNLEKAKVQYSNNGIIVNEFFQTSNDIIYAAGDVIGGRMFTTVATQEAKIAARNALTGNKHQWNVRNMSNAVFTLPPIGSVGYTEEGAKEAGFDPVVGKIPYAHSAAAILMGETKGLLKIVADRGTRQIIGAHFVGEEADELIHLITVAMKGNLTVDDFEQVIPVHPTLAESLIETIRAIKF